MTHCSRPRRACSVPPDGFNGGIDTEAWEVRVTIVRSEMGLEVPELRVNPSGYIGLVSGQCDGGVL